MKLISKGAEANIYLKGNVVVKDRIKKSYRIKAIDDRLRKSRNKREQKVLLKLKEKGFPVPEIIEGDETRFSMNYIKGGKLRDKINKINYKKTFENIGKRVRQMHDFGVIHGDLTTSNMILKDKKVYFIDFGLSSFSKKTEDKAVDLHLLKRALDSKHHEIAEECFEMALEGYKDRKVIMWLMNNVEKRGKHKRKSR